MARLIPQKQIEEVNKFREDVEFSGSLAVSQSISVGSDSSTIQLITGSVKISGSLAVDGPIEFDPEDTLFVTASFSSESLNSQRFGGVLPEDFGATQPTIYVSITDGSNTNDGRTAQYPVRTIKKALEIVSASVVEDEDRGDDGRFGLDADSNFSGYRIEVAAGTYREDNPMTVPSNTTIWGDGQRVTKILANNKNEDLFWVDSGVYLGEMTFGNLQVYPSVDDAQKGFAVAFKPNAFITTSPYVQNCALISNQENSYLELYEDVPAGGGGINIDGNRVNENSPLASMVLDAYTQVSPNGVGCQVVKNGFIQLVSFFTNFAAYGVKVLDGGQAVLLNSNTSFGDYGMYSSGSRFITGSGGNLDAFESVKDNYTIIIDTIEDGLSEIPNVVSNTSGAFYRGEVSQSFISGFSSASVAETSNDLFNIVQTIITTGSTVQPTIDNRVSTVGELPITSSQTGSSIEVTNVSSSFEIVKDIIGNGTGSYSIVSNTSGAIYHGNTTPITSSITASQIDTDIVSSRFDLVKEIISSSTYTESRTRNYEAGIKVTDEPQVVGGGIDDSSIVPFVTQSFFFVSDSILNGTGSLPSPTQYGTPRSGSDVTDTYQLLKDNISFIQSETIAYVSSSWSEFDYNEASCSRDIGLIVSGAAEDLLHGVYSASIVSAKSYYENPSQATTSQKFPTADAIEYASGIVTNIVNGVELEFPSSSVSSSHEVLRQNREFIQNEVISYLSSSWSELDYNEVSCSRDVGYIVDAVRTDLLYGGNERSITAGEFYYDFPSPAISSSLTPDSQNQLYPTLDGVEFTKGTSLNLISGVTYNTASVEVSSSREILSSNKEFIQDLTIDYINKEYPFLSYNEVSCSRDVGLIIDAVKTDLYYGGNERSVTAGNFYYLFPSPATDSQLNQTISGVGFAQGTSLNLLEGLEYTLATGSIVGDRIKNTENFIKATDTTFVSASITGSGDDISSISSSFNIVEDIILNMSSSESSIFNWENNIRRGSEAQETSFQVTSSVIENDISTSFAFITDSLLNGTGSLPSVTPYTTASNSTEIIQASQQLIDNIPFIQEEALAYLDSRWSDLDYNVASCSRDIGTIVSASATDLLYNSNSASVAAAKAYYEVPSKVNGEQKYPTINSIEFASGISRAVVKGISFNEPSSSTMESYDIINQNRQFIQDEVIAYISSSWSEFEYNSVSCSRDVGYIIDAAKTDLYYGGNESSIQAGDFYNIFTSSATVGGETPNESAQLQPTLDGIRFAGDTTINIISGANYAYPSNEISGGVVLLRNNREFIQEEVITFISSSWSDFEYNSVSCSRDVGLIVDAVATDIYYGGNERSILSGEYYYRIPSIATTTEKPQTLDGIRFAKGTAENVINQKQYRRPNFTNRESVEILLNRRQELKERAIDFANNAFPDFDYNEASCSRDVGFIVDALSTDLLYGGNERSIKSAESYYNGVYGDASEVIENEQQETAETNRFLRTQIQNIVRNAPLEEFGSLIITTGHDFSYAGSGVTYKALPPNQGGNGEPDPDKEITEVAGGRVYFTSGNELGDFRIGGGLVINQATGTLQGRTFSRSLFTLVTPFSLALQD